MSSSDDSYGFENYGLEFYEEEEGPPLIKKRSRLIAAVVQNNVDILKDLLDSPRWYKTKDKYGYNLLQIAIIRENKDVFDYLLSLRDFPLEAVDHDNQTALMLALSGFVSNDIFINGYYALELIKRGVNVDGICYDNNSLLHCALDRNFTEVAKLLIEKGVDVNSQNDDGETPLHLCIFSDDAIELTPLMLCHGADSWAGNKYEFTAFEQSILYGHNIPYIVQEHLFNYMFDQYTQDKIHPRVLVKLALTRSPFFHKILKHNIGVYKEDHFSLDSVNSLFCIDLDYFKSLINKFDYVVAAVLQVLTDSNGQFCSFTSASIENFNLLLQSPLSGTTLNFIQNLKISQLIERLHEKDLSAEVITELILYLLSYGMATDDLALELVYKRYGYHELFKVLLHMEVKLNDNKGRDIMPGIIVNVSSSLENYLENPDRYSVEAIEELLDYFAHPKLKEVCYQRGNKNLTSKVKDLPQVCLLVELARNVCRKFIVERFKVTTTSEFYTILNWLPISVVHKKIIAFETKLY